MSENCPLDTMPEPSGGTYWDNGVPVECLPCLWRALDSDAVCETRFGEEKSGDEETWHCRGLRVLGGDGEREAVEEVGVDVNGNNEEALLSRAVVGFVCEKTRN